MKINKLRITFMLFGILILVFSMLTTFGCSDNSEGDDDDSGCGCSDCGCESCDEDDEKEDEEDNSENVGT
jgi:hypothetical protein